MGNPPRRPPDPPTVRPRMASRPAIEEEDVIPLPRDTSRELEAFRRRLLAEVNAQIEGAKDGIAEHVKHVVRAELAPHLEDLRKIDGIAKTLDAMRIEQQNRDREVARYRAERETKESATADAREQLDRTLDIASKLAGIHSQREEIADKRIDAARRYKRALWGTIAGIVVALATLAGTVIGSHTRGAEETHERK